MFGICSIVKPHNQRVRHMREKKPAEFYTIRDVSELLNVDYKTVYTIVANGEIPSHKLTNKLIRISKTDLNQWLETKKANSYG